MHDEVKDVVVTFRCPDSMAAELARLGAATDNTRSNVCYVLVAAALAGNLANDIFPALAK